MAANDYLLFVYGVMMTGEAEHARLGGAESLGPTQTEPRFELVDLGAEPALVPNGATSVRGELYALAPQALAVVDVYHGHPLRYRRTTIRLADGRAAEAHLINPEQARAKRRIRTGDWRTRLTPRASTLDERPWSRFARDRGRPPR